ncbi:MAG TPA: DUF4349 domain-containing protein [Steroidobacteraceae bacterium]|jgi:hypothetical protein|nr:DUF4349 domain-containing protein [Steroidobacteraceae bacterium]
MRGVWPGTIMALAFIALSACQKKEAAGGDAGEAQSPSTMGLAAPTGSSGGSQQPDTLAYEHTVTVDLGKDAVSGRLRDIEAACRADVASRCAILESSLRWSAGLPSASIRMRLARGGVDSLIDLASRDGKITARSTQAEDLAQPVADTERQLALLSVHRDRLTEIMKSRDLKIDQLITVSRELAGVQSQIDSLGSAHANLIRRIDTDLLTIDLSPPQADFESESTPVKDAVRQFGREFREALATVIAFVAWLVPWLFVILPGLVLLRMFWRWVSRWLGRFERGGNAVA